MSREYVFETLEYKGFTIKIIQDQDAEEPDYGENEIFISAESNSCGYRSYQLGRAGYAGSGECHMLWGEGKWGAFGDAIPEEAEEGESEAYDLYTEWKAQFDPSCVVWPIRCGDAHGPGSFQIWEVHDSDEWESIEGYVFIRVPVGDLERLADSRDLEKMKNGIIEMYEQWCRGEVYGYVIEDSDEEEIDDCSCWGFFGDKDCVEEAKSVVDTLEKKFKKTVTLIVTKRDMTWEYRTVEVPLFVGESHIQEWARENIGADEADDVQEFFVSKDQVPLFPQLQETA